MKAIEWRIVLTNNKLVALEKCSGLANDSVEDQLYIIGLLENLKQKHLDKLKTLYQETKKGGGVDEEL